MAKPFNLATSLSAPVLGNATGTNYTMGDLAEENGYLIKAHGIGYSGTLPTTASVFAKGCSFIETDTSSTWVNVGTVASPSWHLTY